MPKLYHFTAPHMFQSIKQHGIIRGFTPVKDRDQIYLLQNTIWLTKNPSFIQSWCEFSSLPYDRSAYRFTVSIPKKHRHNLKSFRKIKKWLGDSILPDFFAHEDCHNWFIYHGMIPPEWLGNLTSKEECAEAA